MSGDWRQFYFDIVDPTINTALIDISWESDDTNLSVFVIDPKGRIVQTNVPSGVFGHFLDWPSLDWLGTSPFSQGGGFFPVKNKDEISTGLYVPINQTGTYGLLVHSTLFGGNSTTESITLAAKFTTISNEDIKSEVIFETTKPANENATLTPEIKDETLGNSVINEKFQDVQKTDASYNLLIGIAIGVSSILLALRKKKISRKL